MKKLDVEWTFIGSVSRATTGSDTSRHLEHLPKAEHRLYKRYLNLDERPPSQVVDLRKCHMAFHNYIFFRELVVDPADETPKSKAELTDHLRRLFKSQCGAVMIVFSGEARATGDWLFRPTESDEFTYSFEELLADWTRVKEGRHLLVIMDSNFSGHWVRKLSLKGELTIHIQASARYWQKAFEDKQLGGYFLHGLLKTVRKVKGELVHEPSLLEQTPCFGGSFNQVYQRFDLKLKFEYWSDLRKALGSRYGSWPRTEPPKKSAATTMTINGVLGTYEGDYDKNGLMHGMGKLVSPDGKVLFEGQFQFGKKNGHGIEFDPETGMRIYEGGYENDLRHGEGKLYDNDGNLTFDGLFKKGLRNGKGREFWPNGNLKFSGNFANDRRHGSGVEYWDNGRPRFKGNWVNGELVGDVEEFTRDGQLLYKGGYKNGLYEGQGEIYFPNGQVNYRGGFHLGKFEGLGELYNVQGLKICQGEFVGGKLCGRGIIFYLNGDIMYKGEFHEGVPLGIGEIRGMDGAVSSLGTHQDVLREAIVFNWFRDAQGESPRKHNLSVFGMGGSPRKTMDGSQMGGRGAARSMALSAAGTLPNGSMLAGSVAGGAKDPRRSLFQPLGRASTFDASILRPRAGSTSPERKSLVVTNPIDYGPSLLVDLSKAEDTQVKNVDIQNKFMNYQMNQKNVNISRASDLRSKNEYLKLSPTYEVSAASVKDPPRYSQTMPINLDKNFMSETGPNRGTISPRFSANVAGFDNFNTLPTRQEDDDAIEVDGDEGIKKKKRSSSPKKSIYEALLPSKNAPKPLVPEGVNEFEKLQKMNKDKANFLKKKAVFSPVIKPVDLKATNRLQTPFNFNTDIDRSINLKSDRVSVTGGRSKRATLTEYASTPKPKRSS